VGTMLSIKDYNDESLVDLCYSNGCEYVVNMVARLSSNLRLLTIDFTYLGGLTLNQQIFVDEINLTLNTEIIVIKLQEPIEVTGRKTVSIFIPVPSRNENLKTVTESSI
jgi:hypothetical protein